MPSTRDLPIDAQTQQRMRYIVKDSYNILLVFVFPSGRAGVWSSGDDVAAGSIGAVVSD
ncbi:MAG: hypothetical protein ACKVHE_24145 [Planctomycetales bacterium]|jgi:hypothetical protein